MNAEGKTLGRLAARVAGMLRGKHRPTFTPNVDMGDHVVIINAEKIHLTGNKMETKLYRHHSGYPGGLKTATAEHVFRKDPTRLLDEGDRRHASQKLPLATTWRRNFASMWAPTIPIRPNNPEPITLYDQLITQTSKETIAWQ